MCGFIELCIIMEVDIYTFNKKHVDWWFCLVSLLTIQLFLNIKS